MTKPLDGKLALVTGGARNVGRAITRALARRGAHVLVNYFHSHEEAKRTKAELEAEGATVDLIRASVARPEQVERMFAEVRERFGYLDILVNNAANGALVPVAEVTDDLLDRAVDTNYKGGLRCARAAAPLMAARGGGSIVTVSALGGSQMVMANYLACAPAKAAAEAVTRYLAVEFAPLNIRVNTASAAMLVSEVADAFPDADRMQDAIRAATPLGRLGTPEEFADVVAFLASEDSRWITGQVILADGGLTLGAPLLSPAPAEQAVVAPEAERTSAGTTPVTKAAVVAAAVAAVAESASRATEVAAANGPATDAARVEPDAVPVDRAAKPEVERAGAPVTTRPVAADEACDDDIAVVGMGLAVAGANSPDEFWRLRTTGAELFVPVPEDRWERVNFHSADTAAEDKSYQDTCVFITGFEPDADVLPGLPPADDHELTTLWLRHSLAQALRGVAKDEGTRFSFTVGYTPDGSQHLEEAGVLAAVEDRARRLAGDLDDGLVDRVKDVLARRYRRGGQGPSRFLPHRVGDLALRGLLPDDTELQMVDTACSSSLYAIDIGIKGLLQGKHDIAVAGGAFALGPRGTVLFSKLQGLSKRGAVHALDATSDGVIFADGAGVVVLKRLSRAREDGDTVLAVLKAFGSSSDGKGKAIYAPNSAGQDLAVGRALAGGVSGSDVDWVIAHATGTPAGDLAEFTTLRQHFGTERKTYVTSNKSLVGHTGWAAGVVSLIEAALALEHGVIPHQFRFTSPPEDFRIEETRLEIPTEPVAWRAREGRRRTVSVSGFGFGGTNAHLVVQEDKPDEPATPRPAAKPGRIALVGWSAHVPGLTPDDVPGWLRGGRAPEASFGDFYPTPPFQQMKLPPATVRTIDRCQLMAVNCAHQLRDQLTDFWQERYRTTGVFVGNMGPTRAAMLFANRCYLDDVEHALTSDPATSGQPGLDVLLERLRDKVRGEVPPSNEDAFPGMMPNVISARVANYFDLKGANITLDSGFGSALTAIETASRYLRTGELEFALAGGVNGNSLPEYRALLADLPGPRVEDPAEGAFLFALTTEEIAARSGLRVLGYLDDAPGDEPADLAHARYLGASGAVSILEALHGPARRVPLGSGLALHVTGVLADGAPADVVPARFANGDEYAPGAPTVVRRQVPELTPIPTAAVRERVPFLPSGVVVLTDLPDLGADLRHLPADALVLSTAPLDVTRPGWTHLAKVTPESVRAALAGREVRHLRVVADLSRTAPAPRCLSGGADSVIALHDAAFLVAQAAHASLDAAGSSFVTVLLGAVEGRTPHPFAGLFSGLVKSAFLEFGAGLVFALCTDTTRVRTAALAAENESALRRRFPTVYEVDGLRLAYELVDEEAEPLAEAVLTRESTVVAFGGARGITAEVVKAVAEHYGSRIYVVGSNPVAEYPAAVFEGDDEAFAATRQAHIRAGLGSGRTVAQLNRDFDRMVDARAAHRNIGAMAAHSGEGRVTYLRCDVLDPDDVARVVDAVLAEAGSVDLVLNAPGRNRSARIADKDFAEFTAIRDLKLRGYRNLKRAFAASPPRLWCNFGSLLGHYGQLGEPDYASGNDFLATAASYAGGGEFTVGWTLWDGVGMGANELTKAYFERAGSYSHMAIPEGVHHFVRELQASVRRPSTVHLGEAEWATVAKFYPAPAVTPFYLRERVSSGPGEAVHECRFDLDTDAYLEHHLVRDHPTLPGTFVTEIAAEAARDLVPGKQVVAFEDLRFLNFLRVHRDLPTAPKRIHARVVADTDEVTEVEVRITTDVVSPTGVLLVRDRPHFTARVLLHAETPPAPSWPAWSAEGALPVVDPYHVAGSPVTLTGPFVSTSDTRWTPRGKRARYRVGLTDPVWERFTMPAVLLDGLARTGVLNLLEGRYVPIAAPLSIRRIDLYEQGNDVELVRRHGHLELYAEPAGFGLDESAPGNRFVAATPDGRVVAQMKDMRATVIGYVDTVTGGFHEDLTSLPDGALAGVAGA
ncbi:SDR family oxidoreductase [Actinosynnema sp. NPDC020468]|uniref:SDR family oxidoreductase n=1 Tax=Actinosynnema sp. NPDC020468 TaxID=3154488 RepID=UPI0033EA16C4